MNGKVWSHDVRLLSKCGDSLTESSIVKEDEIYQEWTHELQSEGLKKTYDDLLGD